MACGNGGWHGSAVLGDALHAVAFLGQLASQIFVILTSKPFLGLLAALVLLLAAIALLKFIFARRVPAAHQVTSEESK